MASTKILENDAVGSDDGNWNETPVRKRHCVIPGDGNDVIRYTMHTADMLALGMQREANHDMVRQQAPAHEDSSQLIKITRESQDYSEV